MVIIVFYDCYLFLWFFLMISGGKVDICKL